MAEIRLKPGWKTWRFDQIAVNINDRIDNPSEADVEHYVGLEHLDPDSLKIRRWGVPSDVEATKLCFRKGDIIFGRRRVYQRKLAVAEFDGICSAHAMVLRPKTDVVLPEFLPFFMQSDLFMTRALEISVGSLSPTINWKTLAAQEFALPPLEEQRRIAELLWAYEETLDTLKESRRSLNQMFEPFLDALTQPQSDWKNQSLGDVALIKIEKVHIEPGREYPLSGVLGFGQGLFHSGQVDQASTKYRFLHRLHTDQLVLRKITAWESPIAIVTSEYDGTYVSPEFPTFQLDGGRLLPRYMSLLTRTPHFVREMQSRCTGTLVRRMRLNPKDLLKIPILLPSVAVQETMCNEYERFLASSKAIDERISLLTLTKTKQLNRIIEPMRFPARL